MNDIILESDVVLHTPGVVHVPTHPANDKVQDSLLNRQEWTREDLKLLQQCFDNYYL